jgi:tetratricopeptide (TPR) repeat protein
MANHIAGISACLNNNPLGRTMKLGTNSLAIAIVTSVWIGAIQPGCQSPSQLPPQIDIESLAPILAKRVHERRSEVIAHPASAEAWGNLGMVLDVHDIRSEASYCYERAQELDQNDVRWPYFLGILRRMSDHSQSLSHFLTASQISDNYAPVFVYIGRAHLQDGHFEAAGRAFDRALELDPGLHQPRLGLARVALGQDEPETALTLLEHALAQGATEGEVHWLLAESYRRLGNEAAALKHFERAQPLRVLEPIADPMRETLKRSQGMTLELIQKRTDFLIKSGQINAAIEEWRQVQRTDPRSPAILSHLGRAYSLSGQPAHAIATLREALELDPEYIEAQILLGDAFLQQDLGLAVTAYERALELDPSHAKTRFKLGSLLVASDQVEKGLEQLRQAYPSLQEDLSAHEHLVTTLKNIGRYQEAAQTYRQGLEHFPYDVGLQAGLAWLLATCPDHQVRDGVEALAWATKATEFTLGARRLEILAAAFAETGDFSAAVRNATQAKELLLKAGAFSAVEQLDTRLALYRKRQPYRQLKR